MTCCCCIMQCFPEQANKQTQKQFLLLFSAQDLVLNQRRKRAMEGDPFTLSPLVYRISESRIPETKCTALLRSDPFFFYIHNSAAQPRPLPCHWPAWGKVPLLQKVFLKRTATSVQLRLLFWRFHNKLHICSCPAVFFLK